MFRLLPMDAQKISIHALREEGDDLLLRDPLAAHLFLSTPSARRATDAGGHGGLMGGISIHALREEGDTSTTSSSSLTARFLSTPSARRATAR